MTSNIKTKSFRKLNWLNMIVYTDQFLCTNFSCWHLWWGHPMFGYMLSLPLITACWLIDNNTLLRTSTVLKRISRTWLMWGVHSISFWCKNVDSGHIWRGCTIFGYTVSLYLVAARWLINESSIILTKSLRNITNREAICQRLFLGKDVGVRHIWSVNPMQSNESIWMIYK